MKPENFATTPPVLFRRLAYSQKTVWGVVVMSILVCAVIAWLHFQQQQTLNRAMKALDTFRQARIDLINGFLHLTLSGDPALPFDREQGRVLLEQAIASFNSSAASFDQQGLSVSQFQADAQAFRYRLREWHAATATALDETELRIAFEQLETQAERLDEDTRAHLQAMFRQQQTIFNWALSGAAVLLAGVCGAVFLAGQARQSAEVERQQAEAALRQSEARYRLIADNTDDVIWLLSMTTGKFTYVSPSVQKLRGYTPEEVLNQTMADALTPDSLALVSEAMPGRLERFYAGDLTAQVNITEVDQPRKGGSIVQTEVVTTLLTDAQGQVTEILGITRDITARKQAEAELYRTMEELKHSNAELEQFAYIASHDLQEPLRGVAGTVQLLQRRYGGQLDERADEFIRHAVEGASRMQTLINDLLIFSRVGTRGQPFHPVDSNSALVEALTNLAVAIRESKAVICHDNLPTVVADRTQLIQLFQNLIVNAIKFRAERVPDIRIRAERQQDEWLFAVADNGIGLEAQYYERIFGVFQRLHTRREYPGTGIGLALCKKIVERHGGHIWVESEPGQGSTFYFTLPVQQNSELTAHHF